jgi:small-conductance mechanosensitive channel
VRVEGAIFFATLFLLGSILFARALRAAINELVKRDTNQILDRTAINFLSKVGQLLIFVIALVLYSHIVPGLRSFGTALLAGVSIASIIVGLAAQNTMANLIAGFSLILYRPFRLDDEIQFSTPTGTEVGRVIDLSLGYTTVLTSDNRRVVLPNGFVATQVTINFRTENPRKLASVPIRISDGEDVPHVRQILTDLASHHPLVQEVSSCQVVGIDDNGLTLSLQAWCANRANSKIVESALLEQINETFKSQIIASPQAITTVKLLT